MLIFKKKIVYLVNLKKNIALVVSPTILNYQANYLTR